MGLVAVLSLCSAPLVAGEPFDYFVNSWATVGLKDYKSGTRITPQNELLLAGGAKLILRTGAEPKPLSRAQTKTLLDGWLPVVLLEARDGDNVYKLKIWATPLPTVKDWKAAFHWPTEGENYLNWVSVEARNRGAASTRARFEAELRRGNEEPRLLHSSLWELGGGETKSAVLRVAFESPWTEDAFARAEADLWLRRTVGSWRGLLDSGARFEVPDKRASECLRASHVNQFIGNDHGQVRAGEGFYDEFYIRDGAYQVQQLEEAGFLDAARKAMNAYLRAQRPDGRFESQRGQLDANGQALWTLWQFYRVTGDREWLANVYPALRKGAVWIQAARRQAEAGSPFHALLPAALADGEYLWAGKNHIVGYDFWNLRGLLCVVEAARVLGNETDAKAFDVEAREYRQAIDAAWKRTGLSHFPPSWEKDGTHWGNTETLWPTAIFDRSDPRVAQTMKEVRERFGGGFVEGTIRWCPGRVSAIHPYMSSYTTLASLTLGDHEKVVEEFYWYLFHSTAANGFPEGIYYKRRFAWGHTVPHLLGAAQYANLLRHMLVDEQGDELHLLKGVPDGWFAPGKTIRVEDAPTHFGRIGLVVRGGERGTRVKVDLPRREPPARVFLHVPASRRPAEAVPGVEVVVRPDQKTRWSLERIRELYRSKPPQRPIPGLVSLPLASTVPRERSKMLDLRTAATTNPFTAPFGVENPGRYLFTGLKTGHQQVGGVPFEIIDPEQNGGRGLTVLHGEGGSARFPREAVLAVGERGKRLFFLGNVHGFRHDDDGAGEWNAVAEYVVQYSDGTEQIVPLITGRTADDWAMPPEATEATVGLRGEPWHLNVLGVELRPQVVKQVVFRDLGTPAAPVLVAVTMELP